LLADADHLMYRDKSARRAHSLVASTPGPGDFMPTDLLDAAVPVVSTAPLPQTLA
jgi:hypothetical protein